MELVKFLSSTNGRVARIAAGFVLVVTGLALGGGWLALSAIGLVPLFAGGADVCLVAPIAGQPFKGHGAAHR
ncbi:MAG: DUF2892 domain-containing protein [Acidobacteriota bacterium]|nr:DUF2892 domain-containing protein [Acidobacteriota bacterium]